MMSAKTKTMERRRYPRVETQNLISHVSIDRDGHVLAGGIGRALDVSRAGLLLETPCLIKSEFVSLTAIDLEGNLIEIKGIVAYCRKSDSELYHAGIGFTGTKDKISQFTVKLIKVHHYQRTDIFLAVA